MPDPNSAIVRQAFTSSLKATVVNRGFRSTPRIASTARHATSRIPHRTSIGSPLKAVEAPIIRTCKWLAGGALAALALSSSAASARITVSDPARIYIQARAAAMSGDHARSAQLLASLAQSEPAQVEIARKALSEAIGAGQMDLALSLAHS